jgi:hypothetical protein
MAPVVYRIAGRRPDSRPAAAGRRARGYNRGVTSEPQDVETIPADLDRFLGAFFDRRGWQSSILYDVAEDRLYLDVKLATGKLSQDDRFFSLVEYFARAQDSVLRRRSGLPLQCRLYATDGSELTSRLHARGASYLDDNARGNGMRKRLARLSLRRRFSRHVLPGALLWAVALILVVNVIGIPMSWTLGIAIVALGIQAAVTLFVPHRRG